MYSIPTLHSQDLNGRIEINDYQPEAAPSWQDQGISTYRITESVIIGALQSELARRIEAVMNYRPSPESIYANPVTLEATLALDGSLFRLVGDSLILIRSCAYCGTGEFRSIPLKDLADIGYALAIWEPRHRDCQESDPVNWLYS